MALEGLELISKEGFLMDKKIRVCVTGSSGFIGQKLIELLSFNSNIEVIPFEGDLLIKEDIEKFFKKNENIDQIVNLVGLFFGDFENLVKINTVALSNLLEVAVKNGIKKITHTSTGAVYGEPVSLESKETDPLKPNSLYGLSKKYTEECVQYYADNFSLEYVILRFPNVYGKGNNKGVIFNFLDAIKTKGKITINGDGTQSRNFLHVSDAARAIEKAISYNKNGIFNISNPGKVTLNDLVASLKEKYQFEVEYQPADNNMKDILLDISLAKKELGFEPEVKEVLLEE